MPRCGWFVVHGMPLCHGADACIHSACMNVKDCRRRPLPQTLHIKTAAACHLNAFSRFYQALQAAEAVLLHAPAALKGHWVLAACKLPAHEPVSTQQLGTVWFHTVPRGIF
jgi:hypothetical protein